MAQLHSACGAGLSTCTAVQVRGLRLRIHTSALWSDRGVCQRATPDSESLSAGHGARAVAPRLFLGPPGATPASTSTFGATDVPPCTPASTTTCAPPAPLSPLPHISEELASPADSQPGARAPSGASPGSECGSVSSRSFVGATTARVRFSEPAGGALPEGDSYYSVRVCQHSGGCLSYTSLTIACCRAVPSPTPSLSATAMRLRPAAPACCAAWTLARRPSMRVARWLPSLRQPLCCHLQPHQRPRAPHSSSSCTPPRRPMRVYQRGASTPARRPSTRGTRWWRSLSSPPHCRRRRLPRPQQRPRSCTHHVPATPGQLQSMPVALWSRSARLWPTQTPPLSPLTLLTRHLSRRSAPLVTRLQGTRRGEVAAAAWLSAHVPPRFLRFPLMTRPRRPTPLRRCTPAAPRACLRTQRRRQAQARREGAALRWQLCALRARHQAPHRVSQRAAMWRRLQLRGRGSCSPLAARRRWAAAWRRATRATTAHVPAASALAAPCVAALQPSRRLPSISPLPTLPGALDPALPFKIAPAPARDPKLTPCGL